MEKNILYDSGTVRRVDSRLKAELYGLTTLIYKIEEHHYAIQILNYLEYYDIILELFEDKFRPVGERITLLKEKPNSYLCEIEALPNVAYNHEGIFLNDRMFKDILLSKFINVEFVEIGSYHKNGEIICKIKVKKDLSEPEKNRIVEFIMGMHLPYTMIEVSESLEAERIPINVDVMSACTDKTKKYALRDSELWFDNVKEIYEGTFTKEDLFFFDKNKTKCYLDFEIGDNVNIRNNVLLYDKVFISPPLAEKMNLFLQKQNLKIKDLEDLVERGKLVFLLPNTEERYDNKIISRMYDVNPNAVVSKRGINAMLATYFCELEKKYLSVWGSEQDFIENLYKEAYFSNNKLDLQIAKMITWPMTAKSKSFELLSTHGPLKIPSIGANVLFDDFSDMSSDMSFELTVNSNAIHIASALQGTYYPFSIEHNSGGLYSDMPIASMLGSILNMYQYGSYEDRALIKDYHEKMKTQRKAITFLNADEYVSLKNILDYSERNKTTRLLPDILMRLAQMTDDECENKISEINNLIAECGKEKFGIGNVLEYVISGAGMIPVVGIPITMGTIAKQMLRDTEKVKKMVSVRKFQKLGGLSKDAAEDVYLMDRISRVAKLQSRRGNIK